jgi:hypothetical protein
MVDVVMKITRTTRDWRHARSHRCLDGPSQAPQLAGWVETNKLPKPFCAARCSAAAPFSPIAAKQFDRVELRFPGDRAGFMN